MKAPDKIYIAVYPNDDGEDQHLGDWYSEPEYRAEDNLEYIRKDALLNFIYQLIDSLNDRHLLDAAIHCALNGIIEHINEM